MSQTKYLKGVCNSCGGRLEFPVDAIGTMADCPHCGNPTELMIEPPVMQSTVPRRLIVWCIIAAIIVGLGFVGIMAALKRAERIAKRERERKASEVGGSPGVAAGATNDTAKPAALDQGAMRVSPIKLEKTKDSSLVYAVGAVSNPSDRQRFGVKVELDLLNAAGEKIGTATDYQQVIEPRGKWQFKALVVDSKASNVRLASVKEDQ
jgi:hypothetical protein